MLASAISAGDSRMPRAARQRTQCKESEGRKLCRPQGVGGTPFGLHGESRSSSALGIAAGAYYE